MRCTVAIKPEARGQIYWTMVSIDTLVSLGAPIRRSNCALAWNDASLCLWNAAKKVRHGERTQPRRQAGGDSEPDRELYRRVVDRGHDSTNHKIIHRREKEKSNAIRYSRKRKLRQHRALLRRPWLGPTGCSDPWIPVEWRFLGEASPCSPGSGLQGHYL